MSELYVMQFTYNIYRNAVLPFAIIDQSSVVDDYVQAPKLFDGLFESLCK